MILFYDHLSEEAKNSYISMTIILKAQLILSFEIIWKKVRKKEDMSANIILAHMLL